MNRQAIVTFLDGGTPTEAEPVSTPVAIRTLAKCLLHESASMAREDQLTHVLAMLWLEIDRQERA